MSFFEQISKLLKPVQQAIRNSPLRDLFQFDSVLVSYTEPLTGAPKTCAADYIGDEMLLYLIFNPSDQRWKNLAKGLPVNILVNGVSKTGWAEDVTGYEEFLQVLLRNPARLAQIKRRYNITEDSQITEVKSLKEFLNDNKLIRIKISR